MLTKAKQADCGSAAGRESESPGLFCCQVISGSIKGCLQDAKSISSPIWMPSTLSHFLPNRYQPCSSLPKNCSLQPAATLQIFLQQVKKARKASPPPARASLGALSVHHRNNRDAGAGRNPWGPTLLCTLNFHCESANAHMGVEGVAGYPGRGDAGGRGWTGPPWLPGQSPSQGVPYLPAERSLPREGFCA